MPMTRSPRDLNEVIYYLDVESLTDNWLSEKSHGSSHYEFVRVDRIAKDVAAYLAQLTPFIEEQLEAQKELGYFCEIRAKIQKINTILGKINAFLREAFQVVDHSAKSNIVTLLQSVTSQSMDAMRCVTTMSRKSDTAMTFLELRVVANELETEISSCKLCLSQLQEKSLSVLTENQPFDSLADYLQTISLSECDDVSRNADFMLATSEKDKIYLIGIHAFGSRIELITVSLDWLQERIRSFNLSREYCTTEISALVSQVSNLKKDLSDLCFKHTSLKTEALGTRILSITVHLKSQAMALIEVLSGQISSPNLDLNQVAPLYKTCSAAMGLIQKVTLTPSLHTCQFTDIVEMTTQWNRLSDALSAKTRSPALISSESQSSPHKTTIDNGAIEPLMRTLRLGTPRAEAASKKKVQPSTSQCLGLGINLHLGVEPSPSVPFSIAKKDRIVHLKMDSSHLPKTDLNLAMVRSISESTEPQSQRNINTNLEHQLSLPSTPAMFALGSPVHIHDAPTTETTPFYTIRKNDKMQVTSDKAISKLSEESKYMLFHELRKKESGPSQIPTILANYIELNLPILEKRYQPSHGPSKIPTISPDNEVFCSPERRTIVRAPSQDILKSDGLGNVPSLKQESSKYNSLRSPPMFLIAHNAGAGQRRTTPVMPSSRVLGDVTNLVSNSSSQNIPAGKLSLNGMVTPNLAFSKNTSSEVSSPVSWRSTSPERPTSSMGSRFDEKHLTQPLKQVKKRWK